MVHIKTIHFEIIQMFRLVFKTIFDLVKPFFLASFSTFANVSWALVACAFLLSTDLSFSPESVLTRIPSLRRLLFPTPSVQPRVCKPVGALSPFLSPILSLSFPLSQTHTHIRIRQHIDVPKSCKCTVSNMVATSHTWPLKLKFVKMK